MQRKPLPAAEFARRIGQRLGRAPLHVAGPRDEVHEIAWCTGAAQDYIDNLGVDQQLVINEIATRIFGAPLPGLSMWVSPTSRSRRSLSGARGTMGRAIAGFLLGNYYPGDRRTDRPSKCMTAGDYFERIRPRCF